jgi:hypothetical protein
VHPQRKSEAHMQPPRSLHRGSRRRTRRPSSPTTPKIDAETLHTANNAASEDRRRTELTGARERLPHRRTARAEQPSQQLTSLYSSSEVTAESRLAHSTESLLLQSKAAPHDRVISLRRKKSMLLNFDPQNSWNYILYPTNIRKKEKVP